MASNPADKREQLVSLDELIALNDELAALVRAGTPFEQGLIELGASSTGRLGEMATRLGQRLNSGESLVQIVEDDANSFPPVWRAMVLAGIRSGRLSRVLENMATAGRRVADTRRTVGASLIYPGLMVVLAYLAFVFVTAFWAPALSRVLGDLTGSTDPVIDSLAWLGESLSWWVLWPPFIGIAWLVIEWWRNRRNPLHAASPMTQLAGKVWPSWGRSYRDGQFANFAEILSLLIGEQVPLPKALELSAATCSDARLRSTARTLAERLGGGQTFSPGDMRALDFPPLLGFMLVSGTHQVRLSDALSVAANRYRERSIATATNNATLLPIVLSSLVGGAAALGLGLMVFWPLWHLLAKLGSSI